jgi:hypothetical protein
MRSATAVRAASVEYTAFGKHPCWIETRADARHPVEAAQEQATGHEQHDGKRRLDRHQEPTHTVVTPRPGGSPIAVGQPLRDVAAELGDERQHA